MAEVKADFSEARGEGIFARHLGMARPVAGQKGVCRSLFSLCVAMGSSRVHRTLRSKLAAGQVA